MAQKFGYNGIELEEGLGLDLYEMDLRSYDPAIGRWTGIDPITHFSNSTYNAFDNNPVYWADPSGADSIYNSETGEYVINGSVVTFDEALSYANSGGNSDGSNNNTSDNKKEEVAYPSWTKRDKKRFKKNPGFENIITNAAQEAGVAASTITSSAGGGEDGYGDAYRHAYWMFLITKELGADIAKSFGDNHENVLIRDNGKRNGKLINNKDTPRGIMDLHNNSWGRNYAKNGGDILSFRRDFDTAVINKKIMIIDTNTFKPKSATLNGRREIITNIIRGQKAMAKYERFGEN